MNQKFPEAPEKKQVKKPPNAGDRSTTGEGSARTGDIPTAPQLRRRAESLAEEERRAGIATVLFSLTVAAAALFVCLLVGVLTVRSALPSRKNSKPGVTTDGNGSGKSVTPTDPGAVLFTPGAAVLPSGAGTAKSISDISSNYAVLVDASTGQILAGKNAEVRFSPASMTKVMTLLVAYQKLKTTDLDRIVYCTAEIREYVTTGNYKGLEIYGFQAGQGAKIGDLLHGIGMKSAADCAMMVASYICPAATPAESEAAFVSLMNDEARTMGLTSTHFDNIVGYESAENKSTAIDIAAIMLRALNCDQIKKLLSLRDMRFTTYIGEGEIQSSSCYFISTLFKSANEKQSRQYAYESVYGKFKLNSLTLVGGKTGTLGDTKTGFLYSLVSYATGGGKTYILVTGETSKNSDVMKDAKTIYDGYIN